MKTIWSVLTRRLKTPLHEYTQSFRAPLTMSHCTLFWHECPLWLGLGELTARRSYGPSQADAKVFEAIETPPAVEKFPHAYRWYKHIATFKPEFSSLPGDPSKAATTYGPETSDLPVNPAKAPAAEEKAEDDDDVDLFGSDDEEEDAEAARVREERLAEYKKKKEGKVKPAAKSIVTLDVKPWGKPPCGLGVFFRRSCTDVSRRRHHRHERARGVRPRHREGRPRLGRVQARAGRLRNQEAPD